MQRRRRRKRDLRALCLTEKWRFRYGQRVSIQLPGWMRPVRGGRNGLVCLCLCAYRHKIKTNAHRHTKKTNAHRHKKKTNAHIHLSVCLVCLCLCAFVFFLCLYLQVCVVRARVRACVRVCVCPKK
jgi:hypothetical protein